MQEHTNTLNSSCEQYDMEISLSKTEIVTMSRTQTQLNIEINNTSLRHE